MFSGFSKFYLFFSALLLFFQFQLKAQKVGVVFSGGGAAGYAHIGVLKALEENNIPVDYIAGTSQGSIIGSMYAIGFSPAEIEAFVKTESYKNMAIAVIEEKYAYYFKKREANPSWLAFKLALDSTIKVKIPTNVMSPIALDFGTMEFTAGPSAAANYNFDSLFIPFRCVAADIDKKEPVIFKSGDLGEAVRASISYPFYIPPVVVDGRLLFDGGMYNNFPSNVMYDDFYPDFIIGSTVAANSGLPDEENVFSQLRSMLVSKTNFDIPCEGGIVIHPETNVSLFDFSNPQPTIDSGYVATMRVIEFIKQHTERRSNPEELAKKRKAFRNKIPLIVFDKIYIEGLTKSQSDYAQSILRHKSKQLTMEEIKEGYFRLASDNKITYIYPKAKFNKETGFYDLYLKIKKEKDIITYIGGNFSNRPITQGYFGIQYNYLSFFATEIMANAHFGKLYSSVQVKTRFDFPFRTPFYIEPNFTWNKFDYYSSSNAFLADIKPPYLKINEQYGYVNMGVPTGKKGRIIAGGGAARITDTYYQTNNFLEKDTADETDFDVYTSQAYYEVNSLNRKQYANQGEYYNIGLRYVSGLETNIPGSTSADTTIFKNNHEWFTFKIMGERYFNRRGTLKIGFSGEAVYSTQNFFNNYTASILSAPAFQPTPDSKTIFLENYRANQYAAGGIKFVVNFRKNIELRAEGYIFQPFQAINKTDDLKAVYGPTLFTQHYIGMGAIVWNTPVGPMSFSVNYYDQVKNPFSILFHFGYVMFNKRSLE
ncbi:MAG: patatin-like phospholipase family protein [Bacteroidia bacterium]